MKFFPQFSFALRLLFFFAVLQTLLQAWPGDKEKPYSTKNQYEQNKQNERNRFMTMDNNQDISGNMTRGTGVTTPRNSSYDDQAHLADQKPSGNIEGHTINVLTNHEEREATTAAIKAAQKKYSAIPHNINTPLFSQETIDELSGEILKTTKELQALINDLQKAILYNNDPNIVKCLKAFDYVNMGEETTVIALALQGKNLKSHHLVRNENIPIRISGEDIIFPFLPSGLTIKSCGKLYNTPPSNTVITLEDRKMIRESLQQVLTNFYANYPDSLEKIKKFFLNFNDTQEKSLVTVEHLVNFIGTLEPSLGDIEQSCITQTSFLSQAELISIHETLSAPQQEAQEQIKALNESALKILNGMPSPQKELLRGVFHGTRVTARAIVSGTAGVLGGVLGLPMAAAGVFVLIVDREAHLPEPLHQQFLDALPSLSFMALLAATSAVNGVYAVPYFLGASLVAPIVIKTGEYVWNALETNVHYEKAKEAFQNFSKACEDQLTSTLIQLKEFQTQNETHFQKIESILHEIEEGRAHEKAPPNTLFPDLRMATKSEPSTENELHHSLPSIKEPLTVSKIKEIASQYIENQRKIYATIITDVERRIKKENQKEKSINEAMGYTYKGQPTRPRIQL